LQVRDFETGEARGVQLSSPSMTSYTDINPSYRVIYLDPDTFEPLDSDTYHLDLNADAGKMSGF
jgi:sphingomyelin phosphodiesterase